MFQAQEAGPGLQARMIAGASRRLVPPVLWWARDFPGGQDQVRQARHWIEDLLPQCDPLADIALLASELCANAVVHTRSGEAGGRFTVDVEWAQQAARVIIGDQGSITAPAITARTQDAVGAQECGRGLWLVEELADDWGTAAHLGHRWVWIDVRWQARGGPLLQAPGGYEAVSADIAAMREAFSDATIWWGHQTHIWWAALPGASDAGSLVGAPTRGELRRKLAAAYPNAGSPRDDAR
jgi:anti-sigma regulatory factor (Ser/Thr protein kinase)